MSSARTLSLTTPDRNIARTIAGALQDLIEPPPDALTVFEEPKQGFEPDWRIDAYYENPPCPDQLHEQIVALLGIEVPDIQSEPVPDLNWVAISQAALPPVTAGRFTVYGSHDLDRVGKPYYGIQIEAGEAFGTAHHATTFGCLTAIDRLKNVTPQSTNRVLDLGCGSGILAIAIAKSWPKAKIVASDIDHQSCVVAKENARHNGVGPHIHVHHANGASDRQVASYAPFDIVIANILAGPLIAMSKDVAAIVKSRGQLILSGILVPQAPAVIAAYHACGFAICRHERIAGWSTLTLIKRE